MDTQQLFEILKALAGPEEEFIIYPETPNQVGISIGDAWVVVVLPEDDEELIDLTD